MKKSTALFKIVLTMVTLTMLFNFTKAQTVGVLYGMAPKGGDSLGGVLYNYDPLSSANNVAYPFQNVGPEYPYYNNMIQANDGNYYGMTSSGGGYSYGTLFQYNPTTKKVKVLVNFDNYTLGADPTGSLIQATDGNLYGMTSFGGSINGFGTLFRYSLSGTFTTLVVFNDTNGGNPYGSLIQGVDGKLYGMTNTGGMIGSGNYGYGFGTIFVSTLSGTLATLVNFDSTTMGCYPYGSLIQGIDGNLYGMANQGGTSDSGTMFKCSTTGTFTTLVNFNHTKGSLPYGSLIQATNGYLYGMTEMGGASNQGTLFKCTTAGTFSSLGFFANGEYPLGSVIQATDGNLYGMTSGGGAHGDGYVFKCGLSGGFSDIFDFNSVNGQNPFSSLYQGSDGELYGMTYVGGTVKSGTLFKCSTTGTQVVLDNFASCSNGNLPYGNVIQATDGNLYGMTEYGGTYNLGSIFQYNPVSGAYKTLYDFDSIHGATPTGTLLQANNGKLYGMTDDGGKHGYGILFSITTAGVFDTLMSFSNQTTMGAYPVGALIQAKDGNLYGATLQGGSASEGVLFKYTLAGVFTKLVDFTGSNGAYPRAGVMQASDNNLYGTTNQGGSSSSGTIYRCTTSGTLTTLVNFNYGNGENPYSKLVQATDGNLWGIAGSANGEVFKCSLAGTLTVMASMNGSTTGATPEGSLIQASDGNFYGTVYGGGTTGYGIVFQCTLAGALTPVVNFNINNGQGPNADLTEVMSVSVSASDVGCTVQTLTANVRGGGTIVPYTYSWSTGATTSSISGITAAGTYSVTVTNSKGIAITSSIALPSFTPISSSMVSVNEPCFGDNFGSATDNVMGGTSPYVYSWNNGATTSAVNNVGAGKYVVTAIDNSGCKTKDSVTITQPSMLTVAMTGTNDKCFGFPNGSASATPAGGTSPYVYSWNTSSTAPSINNLAAGTYSVTVTDNHGCTAMGTDTVKQPANTLDSARICMVTVDTGSVHNIISWNTTGITNVDSFKVYFYNSSNHWQLLGEQLFSAPSYYVDTAKINNPNANTVRYCLTAVDSCGNEEAITASTWQNTAHIINTGGGTFSWSGTGYLIQGVGLPVQTYYLYRDNLSSGNWKAIDSVSGTQNTMTDPNYSLYPTGRWRVDALLSVSGCTPPTLRVESINYNSSKSNIIDGFITGVQTISSANSVSVYPNPANQVLNISFAKFKSDNVSIDITDVTGRVIMSMDANATQGKVLPVDIEYLPSGIYFVHIANNNFTQTVKFVKE
jgi:uncharacterized repeat protein (TIGR03803 family)